jgi:DNA adenine methylase
VGGGALFFALGPGDAVLGDVNSQLCATYRAVRDEVDAVCAYLGQLAQAHSGLHYYRVREQYNREAELATAQRAAMFLYLNKTCFNGLHRVNRRGEFNVPVGRYAEPTILNELQLRAASVELRHVELRCADFRTLTKVAGSSDFVYLDPPYPPVSPTACFAQYTQDPFGREEHLALRDVFGELDRRRCKLMLSNAGLPWLRDLYCDYRLESVPARRSINSNVTKRGAVDELIIRNY